MNHIYDIRISKDLCITYEDLTSDSEGHEKCKDKIQKDFYLLFLKTCLKEVKRNTEKLNGAIDESIVYDFIFYFSKRSFQSNKTKHRLSKEKYDLIISEIKSLGDKDMIEKIVRYMCANFKNHGDTHLNFITLQVWQIKPITDLVSFENKIYQHYNEEITPCLYSLLATIYYEHLDWYFNVKLVETVDYYDKKTIVEKIPQRGVNDFSVELIPWSDILLCIFSKYSHVDFRNRMMSSIVFLDKEDRESKESDKESREKLIGILKIIMISYLKLQENKDAHLNIIIFIEEWIKLISITYGPNNSTLTNKNIFDFGYKSQFREHDPYHKTLRELLFDCVNYFNEDQVEYFIVSLFENSHDINMMIEMANNVKSKKVKYKLQDLIENVSLDDFYNNVFMITEIENSLLNIVNSEDNWEYSSKIINRIRQHYDKKKYRNRRIESFLFEVSLFLLFKEKNFEKLSKVKATGENSLKKIYFMGLHHSYNEKNYGHAEKFFLEVRSKNENDIENNFQLLRSVLLNSDKGVREKKNSVNCWNEYIRKLGHDLRFFNKIDLYVKNLELLSLDRKNDKNRINIIINSLPPNYLYNEETFNFIFSYFINEKFQKNAFDFLRKGVRYHQSESGILPGNILKLDKEYPDLEMRRDLKATISNLNNCPPSIIPGLLPNNINNGFNDIDYFILNEILSSAKLLREKIDSLKDEDQYNDIMLALLNQRFEIWGWSVSDQNRAGHSLSGKKSGEVDLTIRSGNTVISRIEALKLRGRNKLVTRDHTIKTQSYDNNLDFYYIIIYYTGDNSQSKFDNAWLKYEVDFSESFSEESLVINGNFNDLSSRFENLRHFKVAETKHGTDKNITFFHLMINLSHTK